MLSLLSLETTNHAPLTCYSFCMSGDQNNGTTSASRDNLVSAINATLKRCYPD
uniref:Uncharacterized protein n=1 Tax=Arundo donax TaxID=35708 RepID=A0A0A9DBV0_ARUDO